MCDEFVVHKPLSGNLMVSYDTYIYQKCYTLVTEIYTLSLLFIDTVLCRFLAVLDRRIEQAWLVQPKNAPRHNRVMGRPLTDPPPPAALAAKWIVKASMAINYPRIVVS